MKILNLQAKIVQQMESLELAAEEQTKTLKYLVTMKDEVSIKIGELRAKIHIFRGEIKKFQDINKKLQPKNRQNIKDMSQKIKEYSTAQQNNAINARISWTKTERNRYISFYKSMVTHI